MRWGRGRRAGVGGACDNGVYGAAMLLIAAAVPAHAQRGFNQYFGDPNEYYTPPAYHGNTKYDGRFTFARIKYRGYAHFTDEGPGWSHDYPRSDVHFMKIMREVTLLRPFVQRGDIVGGNVFALDDPELMKYPVAYFSEPGGWTPTDQEVLGMRNYLLKGGFVIFDDFGQMRGYGQADWLNTVQQLQRVLPRGKIVQLEESNPIFHSFYDVKLDIIQQTYRGIPVYYGIYEDNDPKKRLLLVLNYNNDIGEYWEFSDEGFDPIALTNEAYKLGVNYVIYALTH
ncbi:MAG TPA: DUF4159 domain-containing protein [Gemmatimonadaceae bacterium]|nr:DUF4159 domain-containing protein [Gemmatimonadaceae bacterium]